MFRFKTGVKKSIYFEISFGMAFVNIFFNLVTVLSTKAALAIKIIIIINK